MDVAVQLHLLLNHLPIFLVGLGTVLYLLNLRTNDRSLYRLILSLFVMAAVVGVPTYLTGGAAEHTVEQIPTVSEAYLEAHQQAATVGLILVGLLGALAMWVLWRDRRHQVPPSWIKPLLLLLMIASTASTLWTGHLGGQIRHSEIRQPMMSP